MERHVTNFWRAFNFTRTLLLGRVIWTTNLDAIKRVGIGGITFAYDSICAMILPKSSVATFVALSLLTGIVKDILAVKVPCLPFFSCGEPRTTEQTNDHEAPAGPSRYQSTDAGPSRYQSTDVRPGRYESAGASSSDYSKPCQNWLLIVTVPSEENRQLCTAALANVPQKGNSASLEPVMIMSEACLQQIRLITGRGPSVKATSGDAKIELKSNIKNPYKLGNGLFGLALSNIPENVVPINLFTGQLSLKHLAVQNWEAGKQISTPVHRADGTLCGLNPRQQIFICMENLKNEEEFSVQNGSPLTTIEGGRYLLVGVAFREGQNADTPNSALYHKFVIATNVQYEPITRA